MSECGSNMDANMFKHHTDSCFRYKSDMKHKGNNTVTLQYTTSVKVSHHQPVVYSHTLCFSFIWRQLVKQNFSNFPNLCSDLREHPCVNFFQSEKHLSDTSQVSSGVCCLWETYMNSESRAHFAFLIKCTPLHNHPRHSWTIIYFKNSYSGHLERISVLLFAIYSA